MSPSKATHAISRFSSRLRRVRACRVTLLGVLLACMGGGGSGPDLPRPPGNGKAVLFIGNSLTYFNDLPHIVQALADSAGGERITVEAVTAPDFALEDHWSAGQAARAIAQGGWSVVVLQQGPSSLPESREHLRTWTRRFDTEIRRAGARTALYMVWPSEQRSGDFDRVVESYTIAAADVSGMLLPVGEAWRAAWRRDPAAPLYGSDRFHPSSSGSYLAGLVMYGMLAGRAPTGLPARLRLGSGAVIDVPPQLATVLQAAASEANEHFGKP